MATKRQTISLQLWPSGRSVEYYGDYCDGESAPGGKARHPGRRGLRYREIYASTERPPFVRGTPAEWREIRINERARIYASRNIGHCDSSLVDDLFKASNENRGDLARAFAYDSIENLYQDPSDWTLDQCHDYLRDQGTNSEPDPNPWSMDRAALIEALTDVGIECRDDETDEILRTAVIANIDDETISGLDDWRDACREHAQDNPAEIFEWWRVDPWLCARLQEIGEVVIDNDYGEWWGRCTTGQQLIMDGVLQRIARGQDEDQTDYSGKGAGEGS